VPRFRDGMTDEKEKVGWGRAKFSVDSGVGCGEFSCVVDFVRISVSLALLSATRSMSILSFTSRALPYFSCGLSMISFISLF